MAEFRTDALEGNDFDSRFKAAEVGLPVSADTLSDRVAISDLVIAYALALDTRDWNLLTSILSDPVGIDYSSHAPELNFEVPAADWVAMVTEGLSAFEVTQHLSTNHVIVIDGDEAICRSQMQARHQLQLDNGIHSCTLFGHYISLCVRRESRWKISHKTLVVTGREGNDAIFAWATEKFRGERT